MSHVTFHYLRRQWWTEVIQPAVWGVILALSMDYDNSNSHGGIRTKFGRWTAYVTRKNCFYFDKICRPILELINYRCCKMTAAYTISVSTSHGIILHVPSICSFFAHIGLIFLLLNTRLQARWSCT